MAASPAETPSQLALLVGEVIDDQALRLTGRSLGTVASHRCAQEVLAVALPMVADAIEALGTSNTLPIGPRIAFRRSAALVRSIAEDVSSE